MNSNDFRQEIETKRPKYLTQYASLVEAISNKGASNGGDYIQFGAYYQTYMYAFMIGYRLGTCIPISGESKDFAPISYWKPNEMVNYILMLVLSDSEEKLGFSWISLESMDDEKAKNAVSNIIRRIEGYANAGFEYIQNLYDNKKEEFKDPFVFMNILKGIVDKQ